MSAVYWGNELRAASCFRQSYRSFQYVTSCCMYARSVPIDHNFPVASGGHRIFDSRRRRSASSSSLTWILKGAMSACARLDAGGTAGHAPAAPRSFSAVRRSMVFCSAVIGWSPPRADILHRSGPAVDLSHPFVERLIGTEARATLERRAGAPSRDPSRWKTSSPIPALRVAGVAGVS